MTSQVGNLVDSRIVYSVRDFEDPKDKATIIIEAEAVVDEEDGLTYDSIRCNCRFNI